MNSSDTLRCTFNHREEKSEPPVYNVRNHFVSCCTIKWMKCHCISVQLHAIFFFFCIVLKNDLTCMFCGRKPHTHMCWGNMPTLHFCFALAVIQTCNPPVAPTAMVLQINMPFHEAQRVLAACCWLFYIICAFNISIHEIATKA